MTKEVVVTGVVGAGVVTTGVVGADVVGAGVVGVGVVGAGVVGVGVVSAGVVPQAARAPSNRTVDRMIAKIRFIFTPFSWTRHTSRLLYQIFEPLSRARF